MNKIKINNALFIFIIAFVVCVQNTWGPSIYILDEAKNATCAREMMESDDHIVPTFNYQLRTDKPPLHYYFMMVSYKVFGVSPFAARFFSAVFGALTILIMYLFTRRLLNQQVAFIAALSLISSLHFALQFHLAVPDPYLVFFTTLAGFSFIDGYINQNLKYTYLAYVAIGLGVLAKGPIAIALPGFAVLVFIILKGKFNFNTIFTFRPIIGLMLSLIIAFPWYFLVTVKTEGLWLDGFLFDHNIERFADPKEGHGGTFFITLIFVLVGMLPASAFIFQAMAHWWRNRRNDFLFYCGVFAFVTILFFIIADTRLPNYTVPAYPFLAVVIATYIQKVIEANKGSIWFYVSTAFVFLIFIGSPIGVYFGLGSDSVFSVLKGWSALFIPVSLIGLSGIYFLFKKKIITTLILSAVGYMIFTSLAVDGLYTKIDQLNPVIKILNELDTSRPFAHYERMNASFAFYLKKEIPYLTLSEDMEEYFEAHPGAYLITRSDFADDIRETGKFHEIYNERKLFEPKRIVVFERK